MKILITGANGYIGKTLNKAFKDKYDITLLTRQIVDLYDSNQVKEFFKEKYFDIVIHCAIKGGGRLDIDDSNTLDINLKMYYNLVDNETHFNKLIHFGSGAEKQNTLLILDDVGASLKNMDIQTLFKKIIFNRRHLKVQIIILLQSFMSCPKELRKLMTNIFIYKPSKVEFENLFDELFETKKDLANDIMKFVYDKPHQFLMMNIESQRLYKSFDEVIINKDLEDDK